MSSTELNTIMRRAGVPAALAENPHVQAAVRLAVQIGQHDATRAAALQQAVQDLLAQLDLVERAGFVEGGRGCEEFVVTEGAWLELLDCGRALSAAQAAATPILQPGA